MKKYADKTGNSGVIAYAVGADAITIQFKHAAELYTYSYASAGKKHVETMKKLAKEGAGLSTYISQNVSQDYER